MIDLWESLFRTVSALAIVLVLMGIVAVTVRRSDGTAVGDAGGRPLVQVLGERLHRSAQDDRPGVRGRGISDCRDDGDRSWFRSDASAIPPNCRNYSLVAGGSHSPRRRRSARHLLLPGFDAFRSASSITTRDFMTNKHESRSSSCVG